MRARTGKVIALAAVAAALALPASASAAIGSVFANDPYGDTDPSGGIPCTVQTGANDGIRFCTAPTRSTAPSFDGTPIDLNAMFPPEPVGGEPSGGWPMMMVFHGWGGSKSGLSSSTLRWLNQGYAVMSITARGFHESCGSTGSRAAAGSACDDGYIRLMDDRYEVRDAQELAGMLVDQGVVDPDEIGANGGSYGGGMSLALAALNNRMMMPNGALVPWTSPVDHTPMHLAAAAPEVPWSDLAYSLAPNGSTLDYAAHNRYLRPGVRRAGVEKQALQSGLFASGNATGYYCGAPGTPTAPTCPNPDADIISWNALASTGGPYDTGPNAPAETEEINQITTYHSAYYIDDSTPPAPALIANGFNDDLFPVDEGVRYYNKVRFDHPGADIALWESDIGHPRAQNKSADIARLGNRENAWFDYYVKGEGSAPQLGVTALTTTCPSSAPSGGPFHAAGWQGLAPGEVRFDSPGTKTIAPTVSDPITAFNGLSGNPCGTAPSANNPDTANYRLAPAPGAGYTIVGSPTVIALFGVHHTNDQVAVRLLDVNGDNESLIARGLWRPKVGNRSYRQVFQLHPQAYHVAPGHVVKLELLPNDASYGRKNPSSPDDAAQHRVSVSNLELRLPVRQRPGALRGLVQRPADKVLPAGYRFARGYHHAPAQTRITGGPSGRTGGPTATFTFASTDGFPRFECRLKRPGDQGTFRPCSPRGVKSYRNLPTGGYTFRVRSITQGGTIDPSPASRRFHVVSPR